MTMVKWLLKRSNHRYSLWVSFTSALYALILSGLHLCRICSLRPEEVVHYRRVLIGIDEAPTMDKVISQPERIVVVLRNVQIICWLIHFCIAELLDYCQHTKCGMGAGVVLVEETSARVDFFSTIFCWGTSWTYGSARRPRRLLRHLLQSPRSLMFLQLQNFFCFLRSAIWESPGTLNQGKWIFRKEIEWSYRRNRHCIHYEKILWIYNAKLHFEKPHI